MFSNFLTQKVKSIRNELQSWANPLSLLSDVSTVVSEPLVTLVSASHEDVIKKSPDKSCELDPLLIWLLKQFLDELLSIATEIISTSVEARYIPKEFNYALIGPLLKPSGLDPDTLKYYRFQTV